jgi:hypothetical protein
MVGVSHDVGWVWSVLAWLAGPPRPFRVTLACFPFAQMGLQYVLAHRAIDERRPSALGFHVVNAAVMLIIVVALAPFAKRGMAQDHMLKIVAYVRTLEQ